jgi:hypothetical protein
VALREVSAVQLYRALVEYIRAYPDPAGTSAEDLARATVRDLVLYRIGAVVVVHHARSAVTSPAQLAAGMRHEIEQHGPSAPGEAEHHRRAAALVAEHGFVPIADLDAVLRLPAHEGLRAGTAGTSSRPGLEAALARFLTAHPGWFGQAFGYTPTGGVGLPMMGVRLGERESPVNGLIDTGAFTTWLPSSWAPLLGYGPGDLVARSDTRWGVDTPLRARLAGTRDEPATEALAAEFLLWPEFVEGLALPLWGTGDLLRVFRVTFSAAASTLLITRGPGSGPAERLPVPSRPVYDLDDALERQTQQLTAADRPRGEGVLGHLLSEQPDRPGGEIQFAAPGPRPYLMTAVRVGDGPLQPLPMLIDTGATDVVLDPQLGAHLGFAEPSGELADADFSNGEVTRFSRGDEQLHIDVPGLLHTEAAVLPVFAVNRGPLAGASFLSAFAFEVDRDGQRLIVAAHESTARSTAWTRNLIKLGVLVIVGAVLLGLHASVAGVDVALSAVSGGAAIVFPSLGRLSVNGPDECGICRSDAAGFRSACPIWRRAPWQRVIFRCPTSRRICRCWCSTGTGRCPGSGESGSRICPSGW